MSDRSDEPSPRILILDSGVGGLSVCAEIRRQLPAAGFIYVADNAWFPYGNRAPEDLANRLLALISPLAHQVDVIVIGCNTASTTVLPFLRSRLRQPVVGVVPAIKPAAGLTKSRVIGLLATPGTVQRHYIDELATAFAPDCQIVRLGSERLVHMAEDFLCGIAPDRAELVLLLAPLANDPRIDTIVLGCTHFPLLVTPLSQAFPRPVTWIDSGAAIARRVAALVTHARRPAADNLALFTRPDGRIEALRPWLYRAGFTRIETIALPAPDQPM